jgi:hypothetical protein
MSKFLAGEEEFKWLEQLGIGKTVQGLYDGKGFININHIDRKFMPNMLLKLLI